MSEVDIKVLSPLQAARRGVLAAAVLLVLGLFAIVTGWEKTPLAHEGVELAGLAAIFACIAGRCWSTLYIGGKKGRVLVDVGPYSLCRNPLYSFSILGAFGFGAQTGSALVGLACAALTFAVFHFVVLREERFLLAALGEPYRAYLASTPRFLPSFKHWRGVDMVQTYPGRVVMTFLDGLPLLIAIPIAEALENMHRLHWLPDALLSLP